ncbi:MAG: hypothetical protein HGB35_09030 [Geobacteraceae bacterium]|nr:hypothetical protein [Geobacteraceae bacterium]
MFVQSTSEESASQGSGSGESGSGESATEEPEAEEPEDENGTTSGVVESFSETSAYIIEKIQENYEKTGKYGRNWGPYAYTDIGLSENELADPIDHIVYSPGGSNLTIRPE